MAVVIKIVVCILLFCVAYFDVVQPAHQQITGRYELGSMEAATVGAPWPMPQKYDVMQTYMFIDKSNFEFPVIAKTCDLLEDAIARYYQIIFATDHESRSKRSLLNRERSGASVVMTKTKMVSSTKDSNNHGQLKNISIILTYKCEEYPSMNMDEQYEIKIDNWDNPGEGLLTSDSIWGILRGLETLSHIIHEADDGAVRVNSTFIDDFPRFSHRGVLLDTSRHYLPKSILLENLDVMAYNKFNVFHWHIVDWQSFPYQSRVFPDLSRKGAYNEYTHIYTQDDIAEIVEYARVRGIRVLPEFDTPGHTLSWGAGRPGLLTLCYADGRPDGTHGPVNPVPASTYDFMRRLLAEVVSVFPDAYVHLGGDEVNFGCWKSNPEINKFMQKMGFGSNYAKLEEYYIQKILKIMETLNHGSMVWQEVFDNNVTVGGDTIVHVWKGGYQRELAAVTAAGHDALLSSCWYLDGISTTADWKTYYACDPQRFNGTEQQKKLVKGGEACLWGEWVDATNLLARLWPRASAVAERLWSNEDVNDVKTAASRIEEHRCRMVRRGVPAQPVNGPGFCKHEFAQ
ncbi:PREDICTED: beta-hexosaminidase subunit alpha-like [Priapulus caudatus]|uniref:Beta-hexosaminidase n=1 Tax=Priapulus caudatus TaxID=37621 RepID=A0ABM1E5A3_PRICU|nr:PREDICTED: beta-hexosaminidase subunit alpha-like [Priapulus caudatus]